ncbi:hypothetical protein KDJ56_07505 [Brevibacillus composti]|uniref:TcaA protein NTF2-like domain-containing protein n=1 Tax=Brevibacillus composti TaxID=2796470 RepID=A0A7T5ENF3_9BACL|nr:hypothetical protein [Brevibacillus composti]QQE75771.1 hypothetical protein JD108_07825 [Brevibacillus composti]QUO42797.1 hypothetical protein KDJ56_07505 [Brevibacillus composti]
MKKIVFLLSISLLVTGCGAKESTSSHTANATSPSSPAPTDHVQAASPQAGEQAAQQTAEEPQAVDAPDVAGDAKADTFHVENIVSGYEELIVGAINQQDFSYVQDFLLPDSPVYQEQQTLIEEAGKKGISVKLVDSRIGEIKESDQPNEYLVEVVTKLEITKGNDLKTKEIKKVYTVLSKDDQLYIKEIKADQSLE